MAQNITLLYMSAYFPQPAPEGSAKRFLRTQTNEGAISALFKKKPDARPHKIVALCSETVRTKPTVPAADGSGNKVPTLDYFRDEFLAQLGFPAEKLVAIPVPDSMTEADQTRAISDVLEQVQEKDNLYLDLSGGMRDTATLLLIVARYLKDIRNVQTYQVLYSELQGNRSVVRDGTGLYSLLDLITAVDAFFSTGTTEKLQAYLKDTGESDPAVLELLDCINTFADDLALCRVQVLKKDLKNIARRLKNRPASREETLSSLLYQLMSERFEEEFSQLMGSRADSLPALVQWCAHHRMYQQGLTLLSEEMPGYVCTHLLCQPTGRALDHMALQPQNKGRSWVFPMFHYHFCRAALFHEIRPFTTNLCLTKGREDAEGNMFFRPATLDEARDYLTAAVEQGELQIDPAQKDTVAQAIVYYQRIQQYRNQINHAKDGTTKYQDIGLLPLSTWDIQQTLGDVAFFLTKLKNSKAAAPEGVELLDLNKTF